MSGSLTILGLGPGRPEHVTLEALDLLLNAQKNPKARVYGFVASQEIANAVVPDLDVAVFEELLDEGDRQVAFQQVVQHLMGEAFADGLDVLFLATGNALVINDLVFVLRRTCRRYDKPVRIVPGLSFVDVVLDRVFWRVEAGLQIHSAWTVTRGDATIDPRHPALLFELGERASGGGSSTDETRAMLEALVEKLSAVLPPDHLVSILCSSGSPDYVSSATQLPLAELPNQSIPPLSNLWVPPVSGPALDFEMSD